MKLKQLVGAMSLIVASAFSAASMAAIDSSLPVYEKPVEYRATYHR